MSLSPLYGHTGIRRRLASAFFGGNLPASLLLQGPRGVGKQRLGLWLAQLMMCERASEQRLAEPCGECVHCRYVLRGQHPDVHWFFPRTRLKDADPDVADVKADLAEGIADRMSADGLWSAAPGTDGIYVATVRALVQLAGMRPAMAKRTVFLVADAERMVSQLGADQAANAFLKLLEEPPPDTTVILTSSEPGALLPTIRSRVVTVRVGTISPSDVDAFLDEPAVSKRLKVVNRAESVALAGGAPGVLFDTDSASASFATARRMVEAALKPAGPSGAAERLRVSAKQGAAGARGPFSDALDALVVLLHDRAKTLASTGQERSARRSAQAVMVVLKTRERAQGNVSPHLLTASLLSTLQGLLSP